MMDDWRMGPRCGSTALLLALVTATARAQEPRFLNPSDLPPSKGYSQLVEVPAGHRLVFLSGQVPLDSTGALRGGSDFRSQARQVFENLRAGLAFYVMDVRHLPVLREVRDRYINVAAPPASTLVQVSGLFRADVLLEVEAVAAVPDRRPDAGATRR